MGFLLGAFLIGLAVVKFGISKSYVKKHGVPMTQKIFWKYTMIASLIVLGVALLGRIFEMIAA